MKVKEESEKAGLKLNIPETKIMVSGPIISWQTHGENGNSDRLYFLDSKVTMGVTAAMKLKLIFAHNIPYSGSYVFSSIHVCM